MFLVRKPRDLCVDGLDEVFPKNPYDGIFFR